ncbi:MAG: hypothetical protein WD230_06960 [Cucumibacter sp.]
MPSSPWREEPEMKNIAYWFIGLATLFALAGIAFGIWMSQSQDYTLAPAHAHNNLIGWVTPALYGLYYKAVPAAGKGTLAVVHFWVALLGAIAFGPGIGMAIQGQGELLVITGSLLTIGAMAIFAWTVFTHRDALSADKMWLRGRLRFSTRPRGARPASLIRQL